MHVQPTARHSSHCSHLLPHTIMAVALPHPAGLDPQHQSNISVLLTPSGLKSAHGAQCSASSLWQIIVCILIYWLNTVLWTAKIRSHAFCCDKGAWGQVPRLPKNHHFFLFICDSIFSRKYITCKFSDRMYTVAIKNLIMSLSDFYKPSLTKEKYPSFQSHALFVSSLLAVCSVVNKYSQGWSRGKIKFHQKSLLDTLRAH